MKLLAYALCACLIFNLARPEELHSATSFLTVPAPHHHEEVPDRCQGIEMDAVAVNEEDVPYFIKGDYIFIGFDGKAKRITNLFAELGCNDGLCSATSAIRVRHEDSVDHYNMIFFMHDKVFSYFQNKLVEGYPKNIFEDFPGIPNQLDAAVECPKGDCDEDSVLFFKGGDTFQFNLQNKTVEMKDFELMPNCTSAFRFMGHYYCFHGEMFSKFDPKTGEVGDNYPKDARDFFARCANYSDKSDHLERERCSRVHLDGITQDNYGNMFVFRGHHVLHKDVNGTMTADTTEHIFKEVHSDVDAAFSHGEHLYIVKNETVYAYLLGDTHTLLADYPKPQKEVLGIEGKIDAAFTCESHEHVHIIQGGDIFHVEMTLGVREATNKRPISLFKKIDAAMCGENGLNVFKGNHFYHFSSTMEFVAGRALPEQHKVSLELFGCDH